MYQDAGYGQNWQPEANNARRIDPYTRSCAVLAVFFVIGFFLIIIIVLSLIPLYISRQSPTTSNNNNNNKIQVLGITINNYNLLFQSPYYNFDPNTILSDINNRQLLQATLTSMIQNDPILAGSTIDITPSTTNSTRKRRQLSTLLNIIFDLYITTNTTCSSVTCLNQTQTHVNSLLSNSSIETPNVRYEESNSTRIYYLSYHLPSTIKFNIATIYVDPKVLSSKLNTLMSIAKAQYEPTIENSTPMLIG